MSLIYLPLFLILINIGNGHNDPPLSEWMVSTLAGSGRDGETDVFPCRYDPESHRDGPADIARFASPTRAQVVNSTVFVMDGMNGCIRSIRDGVVKSITPCCTNEIQTAPAGDGPQDMHLTDYVDGGENYIYLMDSYNHQLKRSPFPYTKWTVLAGNGSRPYHGQSVDGYALNEALNEPHGIAVTSDRSGNVYIAETYSSCIRLYNAMNKTLTTIAGKCGFGGHVDGAPKDARFQHPHHINLDPRNESALYVSDVECWDDDKVDDELYEACARTDDGICFSGIRKIELDHNTGLAVRVSTVTGQVTLRRRECNGYRDGDASIASFNYIHGTAFLPLSDEEKEKKKKNIKLEGSDAIYMVDEDNNMIRKFDFNTNMATTLAGTGKTGEKDGKGSIATFWEPGGLGLGPDGRVYVGGYKGQRIRMLTPPQ